MINRRKFLGRLGGLVGAATIGASPRKMDKMMKYADLKKEFDKAVADGNEPQFPPKHHLVTLDSSMGYSDHFITYGL